MENAQNSFGLVFTLKMSDFDADKQKVFDAFKNSGLETKFWPGERQPRRAFAKAIKNSVEGENFLIRSIVNAKTTMSIGLVQEQKDKNSKDLKYQVPNILTLDSAAEIITPKTNFRSEAIAEGYKSFRQQLGSAEITVKVKDIIWAAMGISVLCKKAVFVPFKFREYIDRLKLLSDELNKIGANTSLEILHVSNDEQSKRTVIDQFMAQTLEILQKELDFTLKQRQKFEDGVIKFLKPAAFRKQMARVQNIEDRVRLYIPLLDLSAEDGEKLVQKMTELDSEINRNIELAAKSAERAKKPTIRDAFGTDAYKGLSQNAQENKAE